MSQQIAALARETGARLIEPEGRRVRLTPAGQASPSTSSRSWRGSTAHTSTSTRTPSQPATVRVGGFATGIRLSLLPIVAELTETFPKVHFVISEYEPIEAFALLTNDDLDLALTYDYNLALASPSPVLKTVALWSVPWRFGVPADTPDGPAKVGDCADRTWIVNSRNTADEDAVRTLASLAGFVPRIAHEIDSLELVEDLILAGYGVGLLPIGRPTTAGVKVLPLAEPKAILTAYAVTRRGRATWPPRGPYSTGCALRREPNCHRQNGRALPPKCELSRVSSPATSFQQVTSMRPALLMRTSMVGSVSTVDDARAHAVQGRARIGHASEKVCRTTDRL